MLYRGVDRWCEIEKDVYLIDVDNPSITNEYANNGCHTAQDLSQFLTR